MYHDKRYVPVFFSFPLLLLDVLVFDDVFLFYSSFSFCFFYLYVLFVSVFFFVFSFFFASFSGAFFFWNISSNFSLVSLEIEDIWLLTSIFNPCNFSITSLLERLFSFAYS